MPRHNHSLCLTSAKKSSTIVKILSLWHFDFPRTDAIAMVKQHYQFFRQRGKKSSLDTAQEIIAATAESDS